MNIRAEKAQKAHTLAVQGSTWDSIASQCGYASAKSAKESVRQYAQQYGWRWPLKKVSQKNLGRPILGYGSHPEAAYRLREKGFLWKEVGNKMGLFSENAHRIAQRNARKYAKKHGLSWPPDLPKKDLPLPEGGEKAYNLRQEGEAWPDIGEQTGLHKKARGRAQRYAELVGKPWPVQTEGPAPMARAYHLRIKNPSMSWKEIAETVGYSHPNHACTGATRFWTSRAINALEAGKKHKTRTSSRCGHLQSGDAITLAPLSSENLQPHSIVLVDVGGSPCLKQVHSCTQNQVVLAGRTYHTVTPDQIYGVVE